MLSLLLACRPQQGPVEAHKPAALAFTAPLHLSVSPLAPGIESRLVIRGALPIEAFYASLSAPGPGESCKERLMGACLSLRAPRGLMGPALADLSGTATLRYTLPGTPTVDRLSFQGVLYQLDGTVGVSNVVEREIFDPADVIDGDVVLSSPADLAAIVSARAITGSLRAEGSSLTALDLPDLVQVGGDLVLWENASLTDLSLPSLRIVDGGLSLYDSPGISSLQGLSSLREVGGDLSIQRMEGLSSLQGLESLRRVGGRLYLLHDTALQSLDGLDALAVVGGSIQLWELYALASAELPALHTAGGRLDLFEDDALLSLSMPALRRVSGIELHHCDLIGSVGSFPLLTETGDVSLLYNGALSDLSGLSALERLEVLSFAAMPALASLQGLSSLEGIEGGLVVGGTALTEIDLPALTEAGALQIDGNPDLLAVGLPALTEVGGDVIAKNNPGLSQCAFESWLEDKIVGGDVLCADNLEDGCTTVCLQDTGP